MNEMPGKKAKVNGDLEDREGISSRILAISKRSKEVD